MNKSQLLLAFLSIMFFSMNSNAQQKRTLDPGNMREGEKIEYCIQHKKQAELMKNPAYLLAKELDDAEFESLLKKGSQEKATVYKIPVVFHVLHMNGVENISDEQILNALAILNRDYRKLNADTATVHPDFAGMPADVEIEFVLATKAPNGTCFSGITRTYNVISYDGSDGGDQVDAIVAGNNVYQGQWPGNKYMNVFICGEIGGAAGYTYNPSGFAANQMKNGIWVLHDYVGSIGTSSVGTSRTLTHEVGHWLNLSHTWGSNNNPGTATSCSGNGDQVQDTPTCIGVSSCALNSNTCSNDNAYWGFDIRDNVENYMDYSYCSKMFTQGQRTRMRTALQATNTGRANLWTTANLNAVGANGVLYLCKADFSADKTTICTGDEIAFSDDSYNAVTSWSWTITPSTGWTFSNGTSTSSQNPSIIFDTPGFYNVQLAASDGTLTDSEVKNNFIHVFNTGASLPFWEGFESYSTLTNSPNWIVTNSSTNNTWALETTTGYSGTKCVKIMNFGQGTGNVDDLISSQIDLSTIPSTGTVTLSFRYAYRKVVSTNYEYLKVFISGDCGTDWIQRKTIQGNQLSSLTSSSSWKPNTTSEWTTVHMTNVTSAYFTDKFRVLFRFEGEGGNNIYLDDINLYSGSPSNDIVNSVTELSLISHLELYPNPADDELNVSFDLPNADDLNITIIDLSGKKIQKHLIKGKEGKNLVMMNTQELAAGMYQVLISSSAGQKTLPFIVK
ncbi:MAG: M43 family zinc metalloprotease [Crocinitomicaceae bacterium]|jgi:PKD repeat protein|nr:M43 family zinc metalloprotease [Crocinitomicaceae bacterium]